MARLGSLINSRSTVVYPRASISSDPARRNQNNSLRGYVETLASKRNEMYRSVICDQLIRRKKKKRRIFFSMHISLSSIYPLVQVLSRFRLLTIDRISQILKDLFVEILTRNKKWICVGFSK